MKSISNINAFPFIVFILCMVVMQSCTGFYSYPIVARAGDTVSLAVGSADGMTKHASNTTAVFISDSGGSFSLPIRSVFNLYPDKKSSLYQTSSASSFVIDTSGHEAWQTVMVIDLPRDLPLGRGYIHISSIATLPEISSQINNVPISLEIIPGSGTPSSFDYEFAYGSSMQGDLSLLEPLPHALIEPPSDSNYYGAIEFSILIPNTSSENRPLKEEEIRVIVDDMTPSTMSNRNIVWGYKDGELTIMLLSTTGSLLSMEARISIVLASRVSFTSEPVITSLKYFDSDGNPVIGSPTSEYSISLN